MQACIRTYMQACIWLAGYGLQSLSGAFHPRRVHGHHHIATWKR